MKKLILLAVCAVALFAAVPSSAYCANDLPGGSYACAEPWGDYEYCVWGWTFAAYTDNCVDTNNNAGSDVAVLGFGPLHGYGLWTNDGFTYGSAQAYVACVYAYADVSPVGVGAGPC